MLYDKLTAMAKPLTAIVRLPDGALPDDRCRCWCRKNHPGTGRCNGLSFVRLSGPVDICASCVAATALALLGGPVTAVDPLAVDCPYCGSTAGFPCRSGTASITTVRTASPHASRKAAARSTCERVLDA